MAFMSGRDQEDGSSPITFSLRKGNRLLLQEFGTSGTAEISQSTPARLLQRLLRTNVNAGVKHGNEISARVI